MYHVEYRIQERDGFDSPHVQCGTPQEARFVLFAIADEMRRCRLGGFVKTVIDRHELFVHLEPRVAIKMVCKSRELSDEELAARQTLQEPSLRIVDGNEDVVLEGDGQ